MATTRPCGHAHDALVIEPIHLVLIMGRVAVLKRTDIAVSTMLCSMLCGVDSLTTSGLWSVCGAFPWVNSVVGIMLMNVYDCSSKKEPIMCRLCPE